jgi:FAD/FMN-containing dehydrogenase
VTRGRRSFWGWGLEEAALGPDRLYGLGALLAGLFGATPERRTPVPLEALELRPPRIGPPAALAGICDASTYERARHAYGRSYRDVVRGFRGEFPHPPRPISWPSRGARATWPPSSTGAPPPARPSCLTAAAPRWSAAWSATPTARSPFGTATHHHAVGRDHRPGYDRERPDLFAAVLRAAKARLDPAGVLNPGVVFDPE